MNNRFVVLALALCPLSFAAQAPWVVSWGASPAPQLPTASLMQSQKLTFENQTLREIVHLSLGGKTLRVRLSNAYGSRTLEIRSAHSGNALQRFQLSVPGSDRPLSFGGRSFVSIPPNALVVSDPVDLDVPASSDLTVSLFVDKAEGSGIHYAAEQTSYVASGDLTAAASMGDAQKINSWVFLSDVDVVASKSACTLVAFGDSITDGAHSTPNTNQRWPDLLAQRLLARHRPLGVLNAGIGGNRLLNDPLDNVRFGVNALARFDRDVLAQPGVKYLIVLEGINDLGHYVPSAPPAQNVSADDIITALKQIVARAHERGIVAFGATLTPFEGAHPGYFTPEKEVKRKAVNQWIRSANAFDGVIDFDKATRDPGHPDRFLPVYDSGDHLHPSDAGYHAMAATIDLSLFR